ncbi:MAG: CHAD domain-containing protein [Nitrospirae bacterium]|nr:CHAD domain-containing protein [Nitrospirota bacterium]
MQTRSPNTFWSAIHPTQVRLSRFLRWGKSAMESPTPEAIHQARVASRRLRVALRYVMPFYHVPEIKRIRRQLQALTESLGTVRSWDVTAVLLHQMDGLKTVESRAVRRRLEAVALRERKEAALRCLEVLRQSHLQRMGQEVRIILSMPHVHATPEALEEMGRTQVERLRKRSRKRRKRYLNRGRKKDLHMFRIAVKQLRYGEEIYHEHHGTGEHATLERLAKLQGRLGALHDLEVLSLWLRQVREGHGVRAASERGGAAPLDRATWTQGVREILDEAEKMESAHGKKVRKMVEAEPKLWKSIS